MTSPLQRALAAGVFRLHSLVDTCLQAQGSDQLRSDNFADTSAAGIDGARPGEHRGMGQSLDESVECCRAILHSITSEVARRGGGIGRRESWRVRRRAHPDDSGCERSNPRGSDAAGPTANSEHTMFVMPKGGVELSPGQIYRLRLTGGATFGWKYVVGGYEHGEATFNGKPLLTADAQYILVPNIRGEVVSR